MGNETEFALKKPKGKGKPSPFPLFALPTLYTLRKHKTHISKLEYFRKIYKLGFFHFTNFPCLNGKKYYCLCGPGSMGGRCFLYEIPFTILLVSVVHGKNAVYLLFFFYFICSVEMCINVNRVMGFYPSIFILIRPTANKNW